MDPELEWLKLQIPAMTPERIRTLQEELGDMKDDLIGCRRLCRKALSILREGKKFNPRAFWVYLFARDVEKFERLIALWDEPLDSHETPAQPNRQADEEGE